MNTADLKQYIKGDRIIWIVIVFLTCASLLIVYSSTGALAYRKAGGNTSYYILKQLFFQGIGYAIIIAMINFIPTKNYNKFANLAFLFAIGAVCLGLVFGRGGEATGRTIPLGPLSFQPAEFAKVALILWVARLLANSQKDPRLLQIASTKIFIGVGAICLLIAFANVSSAALLFGTAMIMMIIGRVSWKFLGAFLMLGLTFLVAIYLLAPYLPKEGKFGRIHTFRNRIERKFFSAPASEEKGLTQDDFAMIAIHRGGITGVGAGKSQISNFMPAAYNDFVYSIIIEEYGLIGGFIIALLYIVFLTRSGIIIKKCNRTYPTFLATGAATVIMLQALINMAVSAGAMPVTGQPLPWVSWGGTSQLFTAITFGLLLSVSSEIDSVEENAEGEDDFNTGEEISEDELSEDEVLLTENI